MANSGPTGSAVADQTDFLYGESLETTIGAVYQDTSPALVAGEQGALRSTQYRGLHVNLRDVSGNPINSGNPLPVVIEGSSGANSVNSFQTMVAIVPTGTALLQYTVGAGETFFLNQIVASSPGRMTVLVQIETGPSTGIFNTYFVGFTTAGQPNWNLALENPIEVDENVIIQVSFTNNDQINLDVYATISGNENP